MMGNTLGGFEFYEALPESESLEGVRIAVINGRANKQQLLCDVAEQLRFPEYYGENWDAFEECLADILPNAGAEVVLLHGGIPTGMDRADLATYLRILSAVASRRRERGEPPLRSMFPLTAKPTICSILDEA